MPSRRSQIVKLGIKYFHPKARTYTNSAIPSYRRRFNRAMIHNSPVPRHTNVEKQEINKVKIELVSVPESNGLKIIYIHGGGFMLGSPRTHLGMTANIAKATKANAVSIDYSLSPEHPYPKALDEIEIVWKDLLKNGLDPKSIAFVGDSAGGNLALASAIRFRDQKIPLPGCLVLISPALDTSFSGESLKSRAKRDPFLTEKLIRFLFKAYIADNSLEDPCLSLLTASLKSLLPILIHVGSEEIMFGDSQMLKEKAYKEGVDVELFVGEGLWHDWHMFTYLPEAKSAFKDIGEFINKNTRG